MYIKKIDLKNFRNYEEESLEFHQKLNIIKGQNAQGKTNLIESIYLCSLGKSFRTSRDMEMLMFDKKECKVSAEIIREDDEINVDYYYDRNGRKIIKINEVPIKTHLDLIRNVFVVVFSPEDLRIVKDAPEKRRKFINKELSSVRPAYYKELYDYNRALSQRNNYLKDPSVREDFLQIWDDQIASLGAKIIIKRAGFIEKLNKISHDIHSVITSGKEDLQIGYESSIRLADGINAEKDAMNEKRSADPKKTEEEQRSLILESLKGSRESDLAKKTTSKGPHRDDLSIRINGIDARHYGSQGQQRTAALSLKLAELDMIREETGEDPILLLDDVFSELDENRQKYILSFLKDIQIFITSAEISSELLKNLDYGYLFTVKNGIADMTEEL